MRKGTVFLLIALFQFSVKAAILKAPAEITGENLISAGSVSISTQDASKKALVVVFMSSKCPCSNSHVAEVKKIADKYKDFRFVVIHSNFDESKTEAQTYFKAAGFSFEVIEDQKSKLADQFKAYKTPHAFVISPQGEVLYQGGVTNSAAAEAADKHFLADALEDISLGKKVQTPEGRTLGCVIAREDSKNVW